MTPETRDLHVIELLSRQYQERTEEVYRLRAEVEALRRDVLTPRTCGTCRHWTPFDATHGMCKDPHRIMYSVPMFVDDGCLLGWQAREGEGGTR